MNRGDDSTAAPAVNRGDDSTAAPAVNRGAVTSWALFDWAAQPVFTLIATFIFAPFFATALAPDPVRGQAWWGYATAAAAIVVALLSPLLGAVADHAGPRKPWLAALGLLLIVGASLLWWATPGSPHAVTLALLGFMLAIIGAELATVVNNAMMPSLVPPERMGRLSGLGWALGYLGGLVSLAIVLGFLAASPQTGLTLLGAPPALGLDAATREGDRAVGPLAALWFVVFTLPLFLLVPDRPRGQPIGRAVARGLADLRGMLGTLRARPDLARFLVANMLYADGLAALFAFGGIYAAGVFGWQAIEIGIFGILLTVTGTAGALLGGRLDDRAGPRRVILACLAILILACIGIAGTTTERALFVLPTAAPAPGDGLYATRAEQIYLALGLLIGAVAGPVQASARSALVRLCPPGQVGQGFGLLALAGKATSFLGPLLVALATDLAGAQQAGVVVLVTLFGAAALVLARVNDGSGASRS